MIQGSDIVVVGGGPCGSFSAMAAARQGIDVTVIEEHKEIGTPAHCAGHISIHGLKTLDLEIPSNMIENRISKARFYTPSGKELCIDCKRPVTYVINRILFDRYLAELSSQRGVSYLHGVDTRSLWIDSNRVKGVCVSGEKSWKVGAKVVIDAEGASADLLRKASLPTPNRTTFVTGVQGYSATVSDVDLDSVEIYLGKGYAPGFFAWIIPRRDGSAKVGLATNRGNPRTLIEHFSRKHPTASKKIMQSLSNISFHPIPLGGPPSRTYGNGLIVVGDAASQVKPTTGGGVVFGLTCSRIAGDTAAEAVLADDYSSEFLSRYQTLWRKRLGREFKIGRGTRRILSGLSDRAIDRIFSIGETFHVDDSLGDTSEIDFQGRILQSALMKPNVAFAFLCSLLVSLLP